MTSNSEQVTLTQVEEGFARVRNESGRSLGVVAREKHGSTRTGTRWFARYAGTTVGSADTRAKAAQLLVDRANEYEARLAAAKARREAN